VGERQSNFGITSRLADERFSSSHGEFQNGFHLFPRDTKFFDELIDAHVLRFSNTTETGVRVPRNTQAPLLLPGTLSTTGHCDQSMLVIP
jgi:hypothetical protein